MKSNIPWSVKGIDPEAREAAKIAARRAGMTLGEWLNSLILQSGELPEGFAQQIGALVDEEDDTDDPEDALSGESDGADELQEQLDNLNRKLDQSGRQALAVSGIDESIERLASTIESSRRLLASGENAQKSIADLAHRVEWIQSRVEEVASQHRSGIDSRTLIALERAIAGVASHIEKSDRRNTELVQTVEDALSQLGTRVDGAEGTATEAAGRIDVALDRMSARVDGAQTTATEAVARIDVTLDRLGNRIETSEAEQRRSAARLNERLSQIDDRLAHAGVERETNLATIERRLAGFETKLQTVQTRVETAASARPNMPPDAVSRIEFEDWSRRQSLDLGADTSSIKRSVATIEARLSGVMERIDRVRNETEGQIRDVERKAEDALRQGQVQIKAADGQTAAAIGDLRSTVDEIAQKFDRTNHTTTETMSALEGVLRSLTRRLDALEGRPTKPGEAAAPPPEEPVVSPPPPVAEGALPKRPTWSWGVPQQGPAIAPAAEAETIVEPEPEDIPAPPRTTQLVSRPADSDERHSNDKIGLDDALEVYEDHDDAAGTSHTEDEIEGPPSIAAASELDEPNRDDPAGDGHVDLSNLVFNLKGRDTESDRSEWRRDDKWRRDDDRNEPTIDSEVEDEPLSANAAWLDQARRAAKEAGPSERVSDFGIEDEERNSTRAFVIVLIVLMVFIAVAAAGWIFVRPWLAKSNLLGGTTAPSEQSEAETAPSAVGSSANPTAENVPPTALSPAGSNQPASASPTQDVHEPGYTPPSETDIGQPLPGDESVASAAGSVTAPVAPETPVAGGQATQPAPGETAPPVSQAQPDQAAGTTPAATAESSPAPAPISAEDAMQAAANAGNARAIYALALAYKTGRGVPTNAAQALSMMKQAADKGLAVAQRTLGIWYEQGDGVDKNINEARVWYEKAANAGDVQAMHNLGYFYAQGLGGVKRDGEAAQRWFKSAADRGLVASQVNLAIIHSQSASYGLPSQNDQAYFWSAVAAKRDPSDTDAPRMRDALGDALSAEVKAEMDQAVKNWKQKPVDIIANGGFDASPEAFLPADQKPALSRAELASVQEALNNLGFSVGTADGRPGAQTETAIKAFQAAYRLQQTGVASRELLAALNAIPH